MQYKQPIINMYVHLRRYLTPMEAYTCVCNKFDSVNYDVSTLEQTYRTKFVSAKRRGTLFAYYWTY